MKYTCREWTLHKIKNSHPLKNMHSLRTSEFLLTFATESNTMDAIFQEFSRISGENEVTQLGNARFIQPFIKHWLFFDFVNGSSKFKFEITWRKTTYKWCLCCNKRLLLSKSKSKSSYKSSKILFVCVDYKSDISNDYIFSIKI